MATSSTFEKLEKAFVRNKKRELVLCFCQNPRVPSAHGAGAGFSLFCFYTPPRFLGALFKTLFAFRLFVAFCFPHPCWKLFVLTRLVSSTVVNWCDWIVSWNPVWICLPPGGFEISGDRHLHATI
jgi:hypothetical protein